MKATRTPLIPDGDQRDVLIYAFRYALGRATYAPQTVVAVLKRAWPDLSDADRRLYQREIRDALEAGNAGHRCDQAAWESILELDANS